MAKPTKYQLELYSKLRNLGYPAAHPRAKEKAIWTVTLAGSGLALILGYLMILGNFLDSDELGGFRFVIPAAISLAIAGIVMVVLLGITNFACINADTAERAGRDWSLWFWLSLIVTPLLTWLISASFKPVSLEKLSSQKMSQETHLEQKLKELLSLRDQGLISADEFEATKRKVLGI